MFCDLCQDNLANMCGTPGYVAPEVLLVGSNPQNTYGIVSRTRSPTLFFATQCMQPSLLLLPAFLFFLRDSSSEFLSPVCNDVLFSQSCDIWSLGVIIYVLLGVPPSLPPSRLTAQPFQSFQSFHRPRRHPY